MRDPKRIDEILTALRVYWLANPDLRLGQIVCNIAYEWGGDPFHIEDHELLRRLQRTPCSPT